MRTRNLAIPLAILLAVAAGAAMLLFTMSVKKDAKTGGATVYVAVSTDDVRAGTQLDPLIDSGALVLQEVPKNYVVPGAVTSLDDLRGKTNSEPLLKGEQIVVSRIAELGSTPGGGLGIPDGYSALTIQVPSAQGVGNSINRGDHVRVFATFHGTNGESKTVALIPDTLVLDAVSLGASTDDAASSKGENMLLTFALSDEDAAKLAFAQDSANLWLNLLAPGAKGTPTTPITLGNVTK